MTRGYIHLNDGDWFEPNRVHIDQCCDCCLTHKITFAVVDRKTKEPVTGVQVQFKAVRDQRRTAAARRKLNFTKDHD